MRYNFKNLNYAEKKFAVDNAKIFPSFLSTYNIPTNDFGDIEEAFFKSVHLYNKYNELLGEYEFSFVSYLYMLMVDYKIDVEKADIDELMLEFFGNVFVKFAELDKMIFILNTYGYSPAEIIDMLNLSPNQVDVKSTVEKVLQA